MVYTPLLKGGKDLSTIASLMVKIGGDVSGLTSSLAAAESQLNRAAKSMSSMGKTATLGMTLPIVGAGAAILKTGMDFEAAMSGVTSLMSPAEKQAEKTTNAMHDLALKMGAETSFGAVDAAKGIEELIKAGVSAEAIMNGGLKSALDLAVAGEIDLASSAEIASTALNAFRKDGLNVTQAADTLAGAANASATSVDEMKYALSASAAVASAVGLTFKDTSTILAVFAQNGLKGSDGGTSLKTMLTNLIPKTKEQVAMFKKLNLMTDKGTSAFFDNTGKLKNARDIADLLKRSMSGLTDEQRLSTMETLFGSDAIRAANILYSEGADGVDAMQQAMGNVTAAEVAAEKMNNLKGSLENLKGSIETAAVKLYEMNEGPLKGLVDRLKETVDWFSGLSPQVQQNAIIFGLLVAAIGPLLMIFGGMASGVGALVAVFTLLMTPIGLVIAAAAGLVAGLIILYNTNETARAVITAAWEAIKTFLESTWQGISAVAATIWGGLKDYWATHGTAITDTFTVMWDAIKWILEGAWNFIVQTAKGIFDGLLSFWREHGAGISAVFLVIWQTIQDLFGQIGTFLTQKLAEIAVQWNAVWPSLSQAFINIWNFLLAFIGPIINAIVAIFLWAWPFIRMLIMDTWEAVKGLISGALNVIMGFIKVFAGLFTGNWSMLWEGVKQMTIGALEAVWNFLQLWGVGKVLKWVGKFADDFLAVIVKLWNKVKYEFEFKILQITDFVKTTFKTMQDVVGTIFDGIGSKISGAWDGVKTVTKGAVNFIISAINKMIDGFNGIKIEIPSIDIPLFGKVGGFSIGLPPIPKLPMLETGTNFVPQDGPAFLHKGEAVVPKKYNDGGSGGNSGPNITNVYLDGKLISSEVDNGLGGRINALGAT